VPGEDVSNERGLLLVDLHVSWNTVASRHVPVAERNAGPEDLAQPSTMQLPPPVALGELRALVLGDGPLDLGEQGRVGIIARGLLKKEQRYPEALELLLDQDEVGVLSGKTVGAEHEDRVEASGLRPVPKPVETRAGEDRSADPLIRQT
jgi:hypothetical protein